MCEYIIFLWMTIGSFKIEWVHSKVRLEMFANNKGENVS